MADGDEHAACGGPTDDGVGAVPLGGEGKESDGAAERCGEALEEGGVGVDHGGGGMTAGEALGRVQERSFEVVTGDHERAEAAVGDGGVERVEAGGEVPLEGGDESGEAAGDAGCEHGVEGVVKGVRGERRRR